ncbi:MAG TPA: hypothetical protein VFG76_01335 [Candidatus Polarisedimenticolia bacterium]|nr:hypothetical protein [Candidatus Polarisedimenticolia bacterium]
MKRAAFLLLVLVPLLLPAAPARGEAEPPPLTVTPMQGHTGMVLTITGFEFGPTIKERRVALKAEMGTRKSFMVPLEIVAWKPESVEVRIPKIRPDEGRTLHVVLVDRTGRTLAASKEPFLLTAGETKKN